MPSQSSREGESMPDHWIRTESPDLEREVGERESETVWWVGGKKVKRRRMKTKVVEGTAMAMADAVTDEQWDWIGKYLSK